MINSKNMGLCLLLLFLSVSIQAAQNEPKFKWLSASKSQTRDVASVYLKSGELGDKSVQVSRSIEINIDGDNVTERVRAVWYFPDEVAVDAYGNEVIYWDQEIESLTILDAGVIDALGSYTRFQESNLRVQDSDSYNTFTDQKKVILPLSGVSKQSVSVVEYKKEYSLKRLESNWSFSSYPVGLEDTLDFSFFVDSNSVELSWHSSDDRLDCSSKGNTLSCVAKNLKSYKSDTGIIWRDFMAQIYVSELNDWEQVVQRSLNAFKSSMTAQTSLDSLLAELTESSESIEQKIEKIHQFVARDVRYISMSELGHRITPHSFDSVVENRFGDCKDKSASLVLMLNALGIDAYPVLVSTKRSNAERLVVPSGGYFDHMIVCFTLDGKTYCIDATDANTHYTAIPNWIQGRVALDLRSGSKPYSLVSDEIKWQTLFKNELVFDENANQTELRSLYYLRGYAGSVRNSLRSKDNEQRHEWALSNYQDNVSNTVKPKFTFEFVDSMGPELLVTSKVNYEPFVSIDKDLEYVERDHWLRYELRSSKIETEHYDTVFEGLKSTSETLIDLGPSWSLSKPPANLTLEGRFGSMVRENQKRSKKNLWVSTSVLIPRQVIHNEDIKAFNDFIDLLVRESTLNTLGKLNDIKQ